MRRQGQSSVIVLAATYRLWEFRTQARLPCAALGYPLRFPPSILYRVIRAGLRAARQISHCRRHGAISVGANGSLRPAGRAIGPTSASGSRRRQRFRRKRRHRKLPRGFELAAREVAQVRRARPSGRREDRPANKSCKRHADDAPGIRSAHKADVRATCSGKARSSARNGRRQCRPEHAAGGVRCRAKFEPPDANSAEDVRVA